MFASASTVELGAEHEGQPASESARPFGQILAAARPSWNEYAADAEQHIAQGIVHARGGCPRATLSFNEDSGILSLEVRFQSTNDLSAQQLAALSGAQAGAALTRVIFDREDGTLTVRSSTAWVDGRDSARIVKALFADMRRTLEQEQVRSLCSMAA